MVVSLSGCFDKEGDQRKAFIDFLQNTVMRSGERLPTIQNGVIRHEGAKLFFLIRSQRRQTLAAAHHCILQKIDKRFALIAFFIKTILVSVGHACADVRFFG